MRRMGTLTLDRQQSPTRALPLVWIVLAVVSALGLVAQVGAWTLAVWASACLAAAVGPMLGAAAVLAFIP